MTVYGSDLTATATSLSFNYARRHSTGLGAGHLDLYTGSPPALNGYLTWLATGAVAEEGGALSLKSRLWPYILERSVGERISKRGRGPSDSIRIGDAGAGRVAIIRYRTWGVWSAGMVHETKERRCSRSRLIKTTNRISERPPHEAVFHFQAVDLLGRA